MIVSHKNNDKTGSFGKLLISAKKNVIIVFKIIYFVRILSIKKLKAKTVKSSRARLKNQVMSQNHHTEAQVARRFTKRSSKGLKQMCVNT